MAATDDFGGSTVESPATHGVVVTPNDSADLAFVTRGVYVGTAGNLKVTWSSGAEMTFTNLAQGWHPIRVSRIWSTGTTAGNIVAVR